MSAITGLHGTHAPPPEIAVVPPIKSDFSSTVTRAPPSAATSAPVSPAAPLPTTTRSVVVPSSEPATVIAHASQIGERLVHLVDRATGDGELESGDVRAGRRRQVDGGGADVGGRPDAAHAGHLLHGLDHPGGHLLHDRDQGFGLGG